MIKPDLDDPNVGDLPYVYAVQLTDPKEAEAWFDAIWADMVYKSQLDGKPLGIEAAKRIARSRIASIAAEFGPELRFRVLQLYGAYHPNKPKTEDQSVTLARGLRRLAQIAGVAFVLIVVFHVPASLIIALAWLVILSLIVSKLLA